MAHGEPVITGWRKYYNSETQLGRASVGNPYILFGTKCLNHLMLKQIHSVKPEMSII